MSAEVAAVLREARALIEDPAHWIKDSYRRKRGDVVCYCADGALMTADDSGSDGWGELSDAYWQAFSRLCRLSPDRGLISFNDRPETTHADVLALFDRAIAAEEASA